MKNSFTKIYFYIAKEFAFSFVVSFLFFFFMFFVNQLLLIADKILSKNVPLLDVAVLIFYSLPLILFFSFPFATLVGSLMTIGRFSSDNEIIAFQASGISKFRIFIPLFIMGIIFSLLSFMINDYFLPIGTMKRKNLITRIAYLNPELILEPNSITRYPNSPINIITGNINKNQIEDIIIIDRDLEQKRRIIIAKDANLKKNDSDEGIISLNLDNTITLISDNRNTQEFEYISTSKMIYNILLTDVYSSGETESGTTPAEMSSIDVHNKIKEMQNNLQYRKLEHKKMLSEKKYSYHLEYNNLIEKKYYDNKIDILIQYDNELKEFHNRKFQDKLLQRYELEFSKKISMAFSCLTFIIFAFPVGLLAKRSGKSVGFGIGLLIAILYWGLLFTGFSLGYRIFFPPVLSMWLPNFVILCLSSIFYFLRLKK